MAAALDAAEHAEAQVVVLIVRAGRRLARAQRAAVRSSLVVVSPQVVSRRGRVAITGQVLQARRRRGRCATGDGMRLVVELEGRGGYRSEERRKGEAEGIAVIATMA